jgi:RNA polymerase sigma factor (sigma-70 family)
MTDDATLLRRYAVERANDAFTEIVQRHLGLVYSAALRRTNGDTHLAADVAQHVFTALAREARQVAEHPTLAGWLYVTTRNAAATAMRAERRRRTHEHAVGIAMADQNESAATVNWERIRPVLDTAMDALPCKDRDAVLLRYFERRSFSAIAAALNVSEDAARMRIDRALDKLRVQLGRANVTSTATALGALLGNEAVASAPAALTQTVTATALASAAQSFGVASTLFYLMTSTKTAAVGATVIAIVATTCAVYKGSEAADARRELATLRQQLQHDVTPRTKGPTTPLAEEQSKRALPASAPSTANPDVTEDAAKAADLPPIALIQPANPLGTLFALRNNREAMEAWLAAEPSALALQFEPLFEVLRLTREQQEQFNNLLMEKFQAIADITTRAQAEKLPISDPMIRSAFKDATDKMENGLRSLLGPDGYERLRDYGVTSEIREVVRSVAADVYHSGSPLDENASQGSAGYKIDTTNWARVLAAATFLTPQQATMLRAEADQVVLRQRLSQMTKSAKSRPQ